MNDNTSDDNKHHEAETLSPQVANEDAEAESYDIDENEKKFFGTNDDNGPRELGDTE